MIVVIISSPADAVRLKAPEVFRFSASPLSLVRALLCGRAAGRIGQCFYIILLQMSQDIGYYGVF